MESINQSLCVQKLRVRFRENRICDSNLNGCENRCFGLQEDIQRINIKY